MVLKIKFLLLLLVGYAGHAAAEYEIDLYGGFALTSSVNVTANSSSFSLSPTVERDQSFGGSLGLGVRYGIWEVPWGLGPNWLGLAVDVSYFSAKSDDVEIRVIPASLLLMFRRSIVATDPTRPLEVYGGVGLSYVLYNATVDYRPALAEVVRQINDEFGGDLRLGVRWKATERTSWFAEYRRSSIHIDKGEIGGIFLPQSGIDADLKTNHLMAGWSLQF